MRAYRALLRLYPARVRKGWALEAERVASAFVREARQRDGRRGALSAWIQLFADVLRTLPAEWLDEFRQATERVAESGGVQAGRGEDVGLVHSRTRRVPVNEWILREVRHAARRLVRSPGFAVAAILTLALGIGASTAVFSVVDAVLLRPLPYPEADRLVAMTSLRRGDEISISYPDFMDLRERTGTLASLAAYAGSSFTLTGEGQAERLRGQFVTAALFDVLRIAPVRGRVFTEEEDRPGGGRIALIGHAVWQRRFGGATDIVGRVIRLNGEPFTIVGVMPAGFDFPGGIVYGPAEVWVPAGLRSADWSNRDQHPGLYAVGRLRDGIALDAARADLTSIAAQLEQEYPMSNRDIGVDARSALDMLVGPTRPALLALLGAVALILVIACVNVASLLLVRTTARSGETRLRAALGATRARLFAPAVAESLLLALAGGALGVLVAWWLTSSGRALIGVLPRVDSPPMDARVLVFSLGVTVLTAVLFGLAPVLGAAGTRSLAWMRQRDASRSAARARSALVVVEIALALVVLIGAGLVVKSFARLVDRDPGIDPTGVVAVQVRLSEATYGEGDRVRLFYASLFERLSALPGVTRTGAISTLPFTGGGSQSGMLAAGRAQDDTRRTDVNVVTPDYFAAMGIELREGRVFEERDDANASPVVVVDERFANHFWPGTSAVGQRVSGWGLHEAEVIGVVAHVRNYGVALDSREELYMNHAQRPFLAMRLIVRAERDPLSLVPDIRRIVAALDPDVPADDPRTMADIVGRTLGTARLTAVIGSGFAGLAVLLAAIGIYGVIAYTVTQRRREIGTRAALGALQSAVVAHVVARGLRLALAGVSIGTALAMGMTRLLQSQIHDVSRTDLSTFIVLPLLLLAIAAAASWLPARRAARISPLECLRSE